MTPSYKLAQVELQLAILLIGFTGLFGKLITAGPATIAFGRTAISALAIYATLRLMHRREDTAVLKISVPLLWVVFSGGLLTLHWLTFFHAIQISSVAVGLLGLAAFPVFVTLLEPLLQGRAVRLIDCLSSGLVVAGLMLIAPIGDISSATTQGLLWAVLAGLIYAALTLLNQHLVRGSQSAIGLAMWQQATVAILLLPVMLFGNQWPGTADWLWLLVLGLACTAIPQILLIRALKSVRAQMVAMAVASEPVYGILFAAVLLGEIPEPRTIAGGVVILAAVMLAIRSHRHLIAPTPS